MVALYEDLMIRSRKVVAPLVDSLHNRQEVPIVRVVVLLGTCACSRVEVGRSENSETVILVENAGLAKPLALVFRIISFTALKWFTIDASVKALVIFRNASSASQVHSHLSSLGVLNVSAFFSRTDIGVITFAYFVINRR
jgi:hypothetical protein